jgi:Kef-type K+ transport system membrane component KefB
MRRALKSPIFNAVCISLFTAFYSVVFFASAGSESFKENLDYANIPARWAAWSRFLEAGNHVYIAAAMIALTILVVVMLLSRRQPHDEYHAAILTNCLAAAIVPTLLAIAVFYIVILLNQSGIVERFTFFIVIHWVTVVFANLTYIFLCRWR